MVLPPGQGDNYERLVNYRRYGPAANGVTEKLSKIHHQWVVSPIRRHGLAFSLFVEAGFQPAPTIWLAVKQ